MSNRRAERIDSEIKNLLGNLILTELKDPGVSKMAAITRVSVTPDLKYAKVHVSVLDSPDMVKSTMEGLVRAEPFLRSKLNDKIKLRRIPNLQFVQDTSIEESAQMSKLIDEVTAKDRENAENRGED